MTLDPSLWTDPVLPDRRRFLLGAPALLASTSGLTSCSQESEPEPSNVVAAKARRPVSFRGFEGSARIQKVGAEPAPEITHELIRLATLAPSSHNTQCWKFSVEYKAITIHPDLSRRCPAVDPDDHHLFVSLGCAVENLAQAAPSQGLHAETYFDATLNAIRVGLTATPTVKTPLFEAIASRQCTRGDYDGKPISSEDLALLERAGSSKSVRMLLLTERTAMEQVLDYVVQGNTAQMTDRAFVKELKSWIRFNGTDAVRTGDGLFSLSSGNPAIPTWLGELAFGLFFRTKGENEKYSRQIRSSAGVAIFIGAAADKAHWVEVGRCYERFALQATALGIRNAFMNQPIEVLSVRPAFAASLGFANQRPDLVVRFGRGQSLPMSLRRRVDAVLA